jgi:2,3-bisphosphoglycerate-independent phosphoglycerate mutase
MTYDLAPEMSAEAVTEKLLELIRGNSFDFILVNYANPDMVGHTGILSAAIKACEVVDRCLGDVYKELTALGGILLLTSDHGNCEEMYDSTNNSPHTAHTLNPVPFTAIGIEGLLKIRNGSLSDIAPTVLDILEIDVPNDMTGTSLLKS